MAQYKNLNTLQIGKHLWVFTDPQIIEWERDKESVTVRATLTVHHEEDVKVTGDEYSATGIKLTKKA
jgi:hypothetical protein